MHFQCGFSGPAGSGINTVGIMLAKILIKQGWFCRLDKEYSSVIKGGNNTIFLNISDTKECFFSKKVDFFCYLDQGAREKNHTVYQIDCAFHCIQNTPKKNMFLVGMMLSIFQIEKEVGILLMEEMFQKNHQTGNRESFEEGYEYGKQSDFYQLFSPLFKEKVKNSENTNILETGNSLLAQGGVDSGLTFYAAYPMTPATSIIDEILKYPEVTFFQGEDEIAVAMAMLGATYAGKKAMCGTSGGGFALMTESLSFSIQSEIGGVFIISQRDGPSTGTPTYTAQGDLLMALYSTFGANSPIVMAPSNFEEYYTMVGKALGFSQRYQHPVVILGEKCLSEGYITFNTEKKNQNNGIDTGILSEEAENDQYQRYQNTENGISPYSFPGRKNTIFMATSYEHDESGATNEDPLIKEEQTQKRRRKMLTFQKEQFETQKLDSFEVINPHAHKFLITWGSNAMTLKHVLKDYSDWGLLVIKVFYPFNDQIKQFLESSKENIEKLCFVEMNSEGQSEKWLSEYCGLKDKSRENKIMHYRKTTLYPIFKEEIEEYLNHGGE